MRHQKRNKLHLLSDMDKAYLAGLFDGEGCIHVGKFHSKNGRSPTFTLHISIMQCDENYLKYWMHKTDIGSLHRQKARKKEHRDGYMWQISARDAMQFLEIIMEHLMIKKDQAEIAIEFQKTFNQYTGGAGYIVPRELIERRESLRLLLKEKKKVSMPEDDEAIFETLLEIKSRQRIDQMPLF